MPRMSRKRKNELAFFLNDRGAHDLQRIVPEMSAYLQAELPGDRDRLPPLPVETSKEQGGHPLNGI